MDKNDELKRLREIGRKKESAQGNSLQIKDGELVSNFPLQSNEVPRAPAFSHITQAGVNSNARNIIFGIQRAFQESRHQKEQADLVHKTQLEILTTHATAAVSQEKARADAALATFAETLKTYIQVEMHGAERERMTNKINELRETYKDAYQEIKTLLETDLPDEAKSELINNIEKVRDESLNKIMKDVLANKYQLGPDR